MRVRNLWRKAYKAGKLDQIPEEVRVKVVRELSGSKPEEFHQIMPSDFEEIETDKDEAE